MKKIAIVIAAVFILITFTSRCNNNTTNVKSENKIDLNDFSNITMKVESVIGTKITVRINNSTGHPVIFGQDYFIEVKKGDEWYSLSVDDDIMFTSEAYQLKSGNNSQWSTDFKILYGRLSTDQYRIIKKFRVELQNGNFKQYFISAEFSIS